MIRVRTETSVKDLITSNAHFPGVNLFISQFEKCGDHFWLEKAISAMNYFIDNLTDQFVSGNTWFLHDSVQDKRPHKFHSTIFGKNPNNTLCINTHVQELWVLQRFNKYESDSNRFHHFYDSGINALLEVLNNQPTGLLHKILETSLLYAPRKRADTKSLILISLYSFQSVIARRFYWQIMKKYPRIVYKAGFTERDLSVSMMSMRYHITNMKDFLMLYLNDPNNEILSYIEKVVEFKTEEVRHRSYKACLI